MKWPPCIKVVSLNKKCDVTGFSFQSQCISDYIVRGAFRQQAITPADASWTWSATSYHFTLRKQHYVLFEKPINDCYLVMMVLHFYIRYFLHCPFSAAMIYQETDLDIYSFSSSLSLKYFLINDSDSDRKNMIVIQVSLDISVLLQASIHQVVKP